MEEAKHICVYSGSAHPELSQQIANYLGISLGKVHLTHFPDGEISCSSKRTSGGPMHF